MVIQTEYSNTFTVGASSATIAVAVATARRAYCYIGNTHATNLLFVSLGNNAAAANKGVFVAPNSTIRIESWNGAIQAIASGASTVVAVSEQFLDQYVAELASSSSSSSSSTAAQPSSSSSSTSSSSTVARDTSSSSTSSSSSTAIRSSSSSSSSKHRTTSSSSTIQKHAGGL